MHDLLSRLRVKYVAESRCRELDPDGLSTFNMNTPQDYEFARAHPHIPVAKSRAKWPVPCREKPHAVVDVALQTGD
jgi:hypothetical protein